jgi:hypothetical protein
MTRPSNSLPFTDCEMNSAVPSSVTEIPREIRKQEREIESMLRDLIRFGDIEGVDLSEAQAMETPEKEIAAWVFIAVLGLTTIIGFGLLWFSVSSDC